MKNICITIHHECTFAYNPLSYEYSDVDVVENVNLGNCNYERLMKIVKECCLPVHGIYFCAPKVDIGKHLKLLRNDSELANFVKLAYDNGCKVELYVKNHGYDVMADGEVEIEVVDEELDDEIEMEDLVDGKFISDKDFGAKVDTQSSSSRNVDDSSVDNRFKVKEGFSYPVFNPNLPWNEMAPILGMKFEHPDQLKDCLINYGVANRYQLWYRRNDYRHISVLCGKNVKEGRCSSQKGKQKVVEDIDYKDEILSTNPGSSVLLDVDTMNDGKTQFKMMYIFFKAMKEGWTSCRRVIGLDGCFLKLTCRGELLIAMGRDSNNQMFPMAWAVVSIEKSENWLWFLSNLGSDFNLAMGAYLTILLDGHKGLIEAVKELLPHVEHRLYARHIYANFKKKWNGIHYKSLFWGVVASTLEDLLELNPSRSCADPSFADSSFADPSALDPSYADLSAADPSIAYLNQSFTGLLNCVEQMRMDAEITDAEITALADMNEAGEREARRKDAERVLEEAKKKGVYRKRGAGGWRGPFKRIANQMRKKEDPNGVLLNLQFPLYMFGVEYKGSVNSSSLGQHRKCLAGFAGVREVLSTTGRSQKQWVGIGRIQFDVEDDEDIF
ncbi:splicing factor [Tanacetum coccineum]